MKKLILLSLSILFASSAFSQNFLGMKIKKYGLTTTYDQDRVKNLDAQYFMKLSKDDMSTDLSQYGFSPQNIVSMTCENPALRGSMTVIPFSKIPNIQLDLGANAMFNRVDGTEYRYFYNRAENIENEFKFRSHSHELALDASLLYNLKMGFFNLYGGVGTNLGMTFAGSMTARGTIYNEVKDNGDAHDDPTEGDYAVESFREHHDIKKILHQRVFVQAGMSIIVLKRLELGIEARRGLGYRYNLGNNPKNSQLLSAGLTAKWNLK